MTSTLTTQGKVDALYDSLNVETQEDHKYAILQILNTFCKTVKIEKHEAQHTVYFDAGEYKEAILKYDYLKAETLFFKIVII